MRCRRDNCLNTAPVELSGCSFVGLATSYKGLVHTYQGLFGKRRDFFLSEYGYRPHVAAFLLFRCTCRRPNTIQRTETSPFSRFSQPFKEKYMSELVRIGGIIIFHLSKLRKAKFFVLRDVLFLVRLQGEFEIDHSCE